MTKSKHIGSSFDDYLNKKGVYKEVDEVAMRRVIEWKVDQAIKKADCLIKKPARSEHAEQRLGGYAGYKFKSAPFRMS